MGLVIIISKFMRIGRCENEGVLSYSGFICGVKIKKIVVLEIFETIEKDAIYLVTLKRARIKERVLYGELLKIKKLQEVCF